MASPLPSIAATQPESSASLSLASALAPPSFATSVAEASALSLLASLTEASLAEASGAPSNGCASLVDASAETLAAQFTNRPPLNTDAGAEPSLALAAASHACSSVNAVDESSDGVIALSAAPASASRVLVPPSAVASGGITGGRQRQLPSTARALTNARRRTSDFTTQRAAQFVPNAKTRGLAAHTTTTPANTDEVHSNPAHRGTVICHLIKLARSAVNSARIAFAVLS